jgi:hypothetical protein
LLDLRCPTERNGTTEPGDEDFHGAAASRRTSSLLFGMETEKKIGGE